MSNKTIGFIGIGMMGHGMAKNLLAKGYGLRFMAHRNRKNLDDLLAAGAVECKTPVDLAHGCEAVILCVTGSPQVESIVNGDAGLLAAMQKGQLVIDTSTAEPASSARIREAFAARGVSFIDAPLARTPKEAEEGRLNTMVGASDADFERIKPILAAYLREHYPCRPAGPRPCAEVDQQHAGDDDRPRPLRRLWRRQRNRACRSRSCSTWCRPAASIRASSR